MTIRFDSPDGRFVHLDAVAYESDVMGWAPDNFLMIELDASDGASHWQRLSSALETGDVRSLARFLRDAAKGRDLPRWGWGATESDIEIEFERTAIKKEHRVIVRLNCHFHRDIVGEPRYQEWLELAFLLSKEDLLRIADDAADVARRFPERTR